MLLVIAVIACILQFIIFKLLYPFPDFSTDSFQYIFAAHNDLSISMWPIGYSKFLLAFHWFTHSPTALVAFQYFLLEVAAIYFFFTIDFFIGLGRQQRVVIFMLLFCNPLLLYISNYIGSDSLFVCLSLLWLSELIWMVNTPLLSKIFTHAIFLFLCFTLRNTAYYYPLVSVIAFLIVRRTLWYRLLGIGLPVACILAFVIHGRNEGLKFTGTKQYSLFTGWQLANNALYFYDKINVDSNIFSSAGCRQLDRISKRFFDSSESWQRHRSSVASNEGNFFIQYINSPLKKYWRTHYPPGDELSQVRSWGKVSPVFEEYGKTIIKHHPIAFARYFVLPNISNYFLPPLEKLEVYNRELDQLRPLEQDWFDYTTPDVYAASKRIQGKIFFWFSPIFMFLNIYLVVCMIIYAFRSLNKKKAHTINKTMILLSAILLINFAFSVLSTINVLRYQIFPMLVCATAVVILGEYILQSSKPKTLALRPLSVNNTKIGHSN